MLEFVDVRKTFGKTLALAGVSLRVPEGIFCLLGPNGAGKTTLIKIACGVLLPDRGDVLFDGVSVVRHTKRVQRELAAVFENAENAYGYLSVEDNITYFGYLWGIPPRTLKRRVAELVERLGLTDKRKESFTKLSRGTKQRVALAMALIREPRFLFLDEPTLGLDVFTAETVKEMVAEWVRKPGRTVVLTTHNMRLAQELGDAFAFISKGKVVWQGSKEELRALPGYRVSYRITLRAEPPAEAPGKKERRDGLWVLTVAREELAKAIEALRGVDILEISRHETDLEALFKEVVR